MMQQLEVRPGAAAESRAKLEAELDWLDAKLADGRPYLAGDRFSRADLTVASLLAGYAKPREIPAYHDLTGPDALAADVERWSARPVLRWVIRQYGAPWAGLPVCLNSIRAALIWVRIHAWVQPPSGPLGRYL